MVRRLMRAGHTLSVTDLSAEAVATMAKEGATGAASRRTSWRHSRRRARCGHGARWRADGADVMTLGDR